MAMLCYAMLCYGGKKSAMALDLARAPLLRTIARPPPLRNHSPRGDTTAPPFPSRRSCTVPRLSRSHCPRRDAVAGPPLRWMGLNWLPLFPQLAHFYLGYERHPIILVRGGSEIKSKAKPLSPLQFPELI